MPSGSEATERVWATVPTSVNNEIEARASAEGLKKPEWIRSKLVAIAERDPDADQTYDRGIEQLADYLGARFEQLECRLFHENSAILALEFEILKEAIHANIAAMSATISATPADDEEARTKGRAVFAEAETHFNRRNDEIYAELKTLRDEAKTKSRALGKPFSGSVHGSTTS